MPDAPGRKSRSVQDEDYRKWAFAHDEWMERNADCFLHIDWPTRTSVAEMLSCLRPPTVQVFPRLSLLLWDLSYQRLVNIELSYANLHGSRLDFANLDGAILYGARLSSANLNGAKLNNSSFMCANLDNSILTGANLTGANLSGANLRGANLHFASLRDADVSDADLSDANLFGATYGDVKLNMPDGLKFLKSKGAIV